MCSFKTWYYNEQTGYVVECDECRHLQIGFGNAAVTLSEADFDGFRKHIGYKKEKRIADHPHRKSILIRTPHAGLQLLLNENELENLHNMLEHTDNERKAAQLLELFN